MTPLRMRSSGTASVGCMVRIAPCSRSQISGGMLSVRSMMAAARASVARASRFSESVSASVRRYAAIVTSGDLDALGTFLAPDFVQHRPAGTETGLKRMRAFVASVRREWLNVARTLEMGPGRIAWRVILPAAAPTILTGMRISIGIAWLVIVAAEMLVGGTGIGYFVWNEWNNLSITNVITAILVIGLVGMVLDQVLARLARLVTFPE